MDKNLLLQAKERKDRQNILTDADYKSTMSDFILKIYLNCTPNKYGEAFQTKLKHTVGTSLKSLPTVGDRGDLHIRLKKFLEAKISYSGLSNVFSINNIRDWQKIDYYILCFVNENFKASYYCVSNDVIINNPDIKLTGMNNTASANKHNKNVGKKATIKPSDVKRLFEKHNLLSGTSYNHLIKFIKSLIIKTKKNG